MSYTLRPYQQEAVDNVMEALKTRQSTLVSLLTGLGKSLICAELICRIISENPKARVLVVTHRVELIEQNEETLIAHYPSLKGKVGVYSSSMKRADMDMSVTFAGIKSVAGKIKGTRLLTGTTHVIVDECHRITTHASTEYAKLFKNLPKGFKLIGLSATPYRTGEGLQDKSLNPDYKDSMFAHTSYDGISKEFWDDCIEKGYITPLTYHKTVLNIDKKLLTEKNGNYEDESVCAAFLHKDQDGTILLRKQLIEMLAVANGRKSILLFAQTISTAKEIQSALNGLEGFDAYTTSNTYVDGKIPREQRNKALSDFKEGRIRIMINIDILTTGFNYPSLDCIALFNSTLSAVEHVQMLGRGTRPTAGKTDCLVIDFGNNVQNNGTADNPVLPVHKAKSKRTESIKKDIKKKVEQMHTTFQKWRVDVSLIPQIDETVLKYKMNDLGELEALFTSLVQLEKEQEDAIRTKPLIEWKEWANSFSVPEGWVLAKVVSGRYKTAKSKNGNNMIIGEYLVRYRRGDVITTNRINEQLVFTPNTQRRVDEWTNKRGGKRDGLKFKEIAIHLDKVKIPTVIMYQYNTQYNKYEVVVLQE